MQNSLKGVLKTQFRRAKVDFYVNSIYPIALRYTLNYTVKLYITTFSFSDCNACAQCMSLQTVSYLKLKSMMICHILSMLIVTILLNTS